MRALPKRATRVLASNPFLLLWSSTSLTKLMMCLNTCWCDTGRMVKMVRADWNVPQASSAFCITLYGMTGSFRVSRNISNASATECTLPGRLSGMLVSSFSRMAAISDANPGCSNNPGVSRPRRKSSSRRNQSSLGTASSGCSESQSLRASTSG